ncbi:RelA/SpoT family protein [Isachenkonia alkalipeptolytica]|uniref:GTP diphosphokinase n=1 Tax=Isachenkonia alkalipeptolytica TaxID=2565777 RepID=A0AA43XL91_9CLOT|nr:bifunctional (p)ppGpp synthetase/guanosine-3',5'-bis(diphosphate) 3'-pyrophosphohydrolase [Isachenkonia alkalipeptolytica]NBG88913.1 bifunctional (p)ppGpp synthetase/guanosine-3',5'-bis(diphosphate) 3'-pyrophosphohydrolase [Isachenkonia alkalipeptolytica]
MLENLISLIEESNPQCDVELIIEAYNFAEGAHEGQYRKSGEKYFIHPVEVAKILIELKMDSSTIAAGLLHDVIEDTDYTYEYISNKFGEEVAMLVEGVTKLTRFSFNSREERQAENLRKMFIAMAKDIRVILIKLADRLHNMRTLKYQSEYKKKEKAQETLEIYAPIAHRLGISRIKWELEDICLRYIDEEGYYELVEKVSIKRKDREVLINNVIKSIEEKLDDFDINSEINGRPKHFYSIYKKMMNQDKTFEEIFDFLAVRVIVDNVKDCYGVLGVIHTMWKPIPGRFKDYIAMPKPNMYQSLHTTVICDTGEPLEIQIRTWDMHRIAEYGIAAHWKYKESKETSGDIENRLNWLGQMLEWEKETKDPQEFMEALKVDLFTNEVYTFTPKGRVINLPIGSTPIDFAYKIHSDIGNNCVGAKVDSRIVPLDYKLKNGNIVEILTSSNSNGPSRDWLNIVKSSQAKTKIKQWFKKERKEENIEKGKVSLEKALKREGINADKALKNKILEPIIEKLGYKFTEDLFAAIGYGGVTVNQVVSRIKEQTEDDKEDYTLKKTEVEKIPENYVRPKKSQGKKKVSQGIMVKGVDNILIRFAKCCNPVPGDEIIGYITRGRGVSIHRSDCSTVTNTQETKDRFIDVEWDVNKAQDFQVEIEVEATDRKGLLTEITFLLSESKIAVNSLNARTNKDKVAFVNLTLEIGSTEQLTKLIEKLKHIQGVFDAYRVKN